MSGVEQVIRVFPVRNKWTPTDDMVFIGDPPMFRPFDRSIPVLVSVTFTWHKKEGERLQEAWSQYYDNVCLGGPAFNDPGGEFMLGMFLKRGCTITSRGCSKGCPWCFVPKREGKIRELQIKPGWIVQDNNLLACSEDHVRAVFDMLREQKRRIFFNGGLDKDLLKDWHRELLDSIFIGEIWLSCDTGSAMKSLVGSSKILGGIPTNKKRCYVMIGFDGETLVEAERRLESVLELGFMPFCQLYQPETQKPYGEEWRSLQRKWSRPAAYMSNQRFAQEVLPL